jgi:hypothetical protein
MNLDQYDCILFDMDGTLALSKSYITADMAATLNGLLQKKQVGVISGGRFAQFESQLIAHLDPQGFPNLFILPTTGTAFRRYEDGVWKEIYNESLSDSERAHIIDCLHKALKESGYHEETVYGDIIEDRGSQITFSGLGGSASPEVKASWDPDMEKRKKIISILSPLLPEYSLTMGGMTSIDITKKGEDKAYGLTRFSEVQGVPLSKILFVGDKLQPGGNDYPVISTGVKTIEVKDPLETQSLIQTWLA